MFLVKNKKTSFPLNAFPLAAFPPGFSTLLMTLRDVGHLNSTVLNSANLSSVRKLKMQGAGVTGVAHGAFSALQNLTNLNLNQNLLTGFNSSWFAQPNAVVELDLVGNQIEALAPPMLSGFNALTRLNLGQNRIREIRMGSFSSLEALSELDLSGNRMTRVSPQVFSSLQSTRIRLDGNPWDCSCEAEQFVDFLKGIVSQDCTNQDLTEARAYQDMNIWGFKCQILRKIDKKPKTYFDHLLSTILNH